ncbi:uncharacterized protein P884DRAFT_323779 [Thermothelomyces heterothallicus CBS 202.75]|uniref:uncharacterized protein n=1 Tax=Thermothelomyces heterothallicus CBS 202.75 TaxID=1149848 RepID=UPI0037443F34
MAPRRPPQPLAGDRRYNTDFVQRFTQREEERRVAKRPKALTAGQHAALREQLKNFQFLKPDYADNTKISIAGILRKWKSYCKDAERWGSWQNVIRNADRTEAMDFLEYLCQSYRIKSWGTSWEYFRQYKQLYASQRSSEGQWLRLCSARHGDTYHPPTSSLLPRIKLIDVNAREVVRHPGGNIPVGIGPLPPVLPATINDAITFTKELGFGYLWVDYIYIDQEDPAEKAE